MHTAGQAVDRGPETNLGSRSTLNINTRHAYKKSSPHAILKTFADDLKLLPIGPRTEQAYFACVGQLSEHYQGRSPELITFEEVRQYCIHLKTVKKVARQTATQFICAFKLFWEKTLQREWPKELELVRANPEFKLPVVFSAAEVCKVLSKVEAFDHRVCLSTILFGSCVAEIRS